MFEKAKEESPFSGGMRDVLQAQPLFRTRSLLGYTGEQQNRRQKAAGRFATKTKQGERKSGGWDSWQSRCRGLEGLSLANHSSEHGQDQDA